MTTQQKTAAIQNIIANHQDNVNAANAAQVQPGLNPYVIEAMNSAFKADLEKVFALHTTTPTLSAAITTRALNRAGKKSTK
jgi:hypothetical protein